jgi:hypothetical protein
MEIGRPLTGRRMLDTCTPNAKLRIECTSAFFHRTTFCISQWHRVQILPSFSVFDMYNILLRKESRLVYPPQSGEKAMG